MRCRRGAMFPQNLAKAADLPPAYVDWPGRALAHGLVTCDSFASLRQLITPPSRRRRAPALRRPLELLPPGLGCVGSPDAAVVRGSPDPAQSATEGVPARNGDLRSARWHGRETVPQQAATVSQRTQELLAASSSAAPASSSAARSSASGCRSPGRRCSRIYRRMELRGEIRGGRFVAGFSGEQFALPRPSSFSAASAAKAPAHRSRSSPPTRSTSRASSRPNRASLRRSAKRFWSAEGYNSRTTGVRSGLSTSQVLYAADTDDRVCAFALLGVLLRSASTNADEPAPPAAADPVWWSLTPLGRPALPVVTDTSWPGGPIDRFVLAAIEAKGLKPSPEADRRTLIRRLYFDLIGLPPTPEEVDAFVADSDPQRLRKAGRSPARLAALRRALGAALARRRALRRDARLRQGQAAAQRLAVSRLCDPRVQRRQAVRAASSQEQIAGDVLFPGTTDGIEALGLHRRRAVGFRRPCRSSPRARSTARSPAISIATTWWPTRSARSSA